MVSYYLKIGILYGMLNKSVIVSMIIVQILVSDQQILNIYKDFIECTTCICI